MPSERCNKALTLGVIRCPGNVLGWIECRVSLHGEKSGRPPPGAAMGARRTPSALASATENSVQYARRGATSLGRIGERRCEFRCRLIPVCGLPLHALEQHLLERGREVEIRPGGSNGSRLAAQTRDHDVLLRAS